MPLLNDPSKNFINALSAFWNAFFTDARDLRAYFDGAQINLGQLYLEILQTVLGTSLRHIPLFSKYYYKYLEIRESQLFYQEGPSPADDTYAYTQEGLTIAGARTFTNKVLAPTATLLALRDYLVEAGGVSFKSNLFDIDGAGTSLPLFPVRYVEEVAPAMFTDPAGNDWAAAGARVGDFFRLKILGGGDPTYTRITGIDGNVLYLAVKQPDYVQDFSSKTIAVSVVRTPFDAVRVGVLPPARPSIALRFAPTATDGASVPGTKTVTVAGEPFYQGAWAPLTSYAAGDVVDYLGVAQWARSAHTSGAAFDPARWLPLTGAYVYVSSGESPLNCGLARCASSLGGVLTLDRSINFEATLSNRVDLVIVGMSGTYTAGPRPVITLPQTYLVPGTFSVAGTRAFNVRAMAPDGTFLLLRAGEAVQEGLDYVVNYDAGQLVILTPWSPIAAPRVNYTWRREVVTYTHVNPTPTPFAFAKSRTVRTLALWGTDVEIDESALYNNFGYMLDYRRPTSEQYRTFLRGVAQLFLLGPTLERFESALNVMAELPVINDDNELLLSYDSGVIFTGTDGQTIDYASGRNGVFSAANSSLTVPSAAFFSTDIGARLLVRTVDVQEEYVVTAVISSTVVQVAPPPPNQTVDYWEFQHAQLTTRFRAGSFAFAQEDVNGTITIRNANASRNNGTFKILAVDDASTVVLEAPYGLDDATALSWFISRVNQQTVVTSQSTYALPLTTPVRSDIADPANAGYLTLRAFEALTTAFQVIDYVRDPTWWHHVVIPDQVLQLDVDTPERRRVSPEYIEHVYNPLDRANFGDFGVAYGVNDEAMPGQRRRGTAFWFGADSVQFAFPAGAPLARMRDVGQALVIRTPGFAGSYPIRSIATPLSPSSIEHQVVVLDRFPPPSASTFVPPVQLDVELPPLLYRRTVAFVMMDRFLKYHAITIRIDRNVVLPAEFVEDITRLIREAKPSHTYIYLDALTDFSDRLRVLEDFVVGYGPFYTEALFSVDNVLRYAPTDGVRYGDAFRYRDDSTTIAGAAGTYPLPATAPLPVGDVQTSLVKVRFDSAVTVNGGARRPAEGVDYTVDYATSTLTILPSASFDNLLSNLVRYVHCIRRIRASGDPLDPGETRLAYGATNPRVVRAPTQTPQQMGLVDRAVQITLGP